MRLGKIVCGTCLSTGMFLAVSAVRASVISAAAGTYTQSFDSLPVVAGSPNQGAWTQYTTIPGWAIYAVTSGSAGGGTLEADPTYVVTSGGGNTTGQFFSYGLNSSDTDRSLGSLATDTYPGAQVSGNARASLYYVAEFVNDTGSDLSSINVGYTGEEWRVANATPQALTFQTYVGNAPDFSAAPGYSGWSSESINTGLTFNTPVNSATAATLDGHLTANSQVIAPTAVALSVPAGSDFFIRFRDVNDSGLDDALAINNVSVSFVSAAPEPAMVAVPLMLLVAGRRRRA